MNFFEIHEIGPALRCNTSPSNISYTIPYVNLNNLRVAFVPLPLRPETAFVWVELQYELWLVPPLFKAPAQQPGKQSREQARPLQRVGGSKGSSFNPPCQVPDGKLTSYGAHPRVAGGGRSTSGAPRRGRRRCGTGGRRGRGGGGVGV